MIINNREEMIIDNYLKSNTQIRDYMLENFEVLKNQISKNIAYGICDVVYDTRKCAVPNEQDLQEKITNIMDEIIDDFYKEVAGYVRLQSDTIDQVTTRINDNELEFDQLLMSDVLTRPVNCTEIQLNQNMIGKIIERLNSHVAFRNQNNPDYYKLKSEIENYIRNEVPNKIELFKNEMDIIYESVLSQLNNNRKEFFDSISSFGKKEQTISPNEAAFIDTQVRTLDPNGIFDDYEEYESENAKRFL